MALQRRGKAPQAFHSPTLYPELDILWLHFVEIRAEALSCRLSMIDIADGRTTPGAWHILPLLAEREDRAVFSDAQCAHNRLLVPRILEILSAIPDLHAYAFSVLDPGKKILPHRHVNPFVTAAFCLQDGGDSYILVNGERRDFHDKEIIIFDYTQEHEVINNGVQERIVLLLLMKNRLLSTL